MRRTRSRIFTATLAWRRDSLSRASLLVRTRIPNSAGPTKNDYRLRVVEPAEGAMIKGDSIQVVVDLRPFPEVGAERRDVNSMPRPRVDIFLDNENKGTLQEGQNVMTLDAVSAGAHKLVILAKNHERRSHRPQGDQLHRRAAHHRGAVQRRDAPRAGQHRHPGFGPRAAGA